MFGVESPKKQETPPTLVFVDAEYEGFAPDDFMSDPFGYFEEQGVNVKKGETRVDETGQIQEDPNAVKDLPAWTDGHKTIAVVGKKVNTEKAEVARTENPLHEFRVMSEVRKRGLPAARPIARAEKDGKHLLIMEKLDGVRLIGKGALVKKLKEEYGYTDEDLRVLEVEATAMMSDLKKQFDSTGVHRDWKLKDIIVKIDFESKKIISLTPTDWERTIIVE